MSTLTGNTPASTYKDLLQVSNSNSGIDGTLRNVEDGEGTTGPYAISTAAFRINSGVNLALANGNVVFSTSGDGIDFSATADGSGTTSSELLDDYEEGTFTPTALFGGASTGVTYGTQVGRYTKIGNQVFVSIDLVLTSTGSATGVMTVGGLPFTIGASAVGGGAAAFGVALNNTAASNLVARVVPSSATLAIHQWDTAASLTQMTHTTWSADGGMELSLAYEV